MVDPFSDMKSGMVLVKVAEDVFAEVARCMRASCMQMWVTSLLLREAERKLWKYEKKRIAHAAMARYRPTTSQLLMERLCDTESEWRSDRRKIIAMSRRNLPIPLP